MKTWIYAVVAVIAVIAVIAVATYFIYSHYIFPATIKPRVLKVGTSPDFPPFEYIDERTNEVTGIDIDLIKAIAKRLGYNIEIVSMDFDGLIPALEQGHVNIVISGMTITEEREKRVDFSIPYWEADQAVIVARGSTYKPQSLEDLDGHVVGVQSGTTAAELLDSLVEQGYSIGLKRYTSYTLAVQDLVNGRVDAVVVDSPVARTLEKIYGVEVSCIVSTGEKYGIAVREGDRELLEQINRALNDILNSSEWDEIVSRYLG